MNTLIARVLVALALSLGLSLVLSLAGCSAPRSEPGENKSAATEQDAHVVSMEDFKAFVAGIPPPSIPPRDVRLTVGEGGMLTVQIEIARNTAGRPTYFYRDMERSKFDNSTRMNQLRVTSSLDGTTFVPVVERPLATLEVAELNRGVDRVRLNPVPGMDPTHKHLKIEVTCDVHRAHGFLGFKKDFTAQDELTLHLP